MSGTSRRSLGHEVLALFTLIFQANRTSRKVWEYIWKRQTFFYQMLATRLRLAARIAQPGLLTLWHHMQSHRMPDRSESPNHKHFALLDVKNLPFLRRFQEGISFPRSAERSILRLPLSKHCAVPFALQSTFRGGQKGRKRGGQQRAKKGKKDARKQVRKTMCVF